MQMRTSVWLSDMPPERILRRSIGRQGFAAFVGMAAVAWGQGLAGGPRPPSSPQQKVADPMEAAIPFGPAIELPVILEGQITNHIGMGEAGVAVTLRRTVAGGEGPIVATAATDEFGDFALRSAERIDADVTVTMAKQGRAPIARQLQLRAGDSPEFLSEQMTGNLTVTGRVIDALNERPVAGAVVVAQTDYYQRSDKTDQEGRFSIRGWSPGRGELVVEADGFGRDVQTIETRPSGDTTRALGRTEDAQTDRRGVSGEEDSTGQSGAELVIRLKRQRIVQLTIVDDADRPIHGVTVECSDPPRDDFRTGLSDETGTLTISGLHFDAAMLGLRLTHEDHVSSQGFDREIVLPPTEAESKHRLVLVQAGRLTGTISASDSGRPLNGARVTVGSTSSETSPRDWADFQGKYTVTGVAPGSATVTVHLSGFAPELRTVNVAAGMPTILDLQLGSGNVLKGVVKDQTGQPVAGAYIEAGKWRGQETLGLRAMTDVTGQFTIESAPDDAFEVHVRTRRGGASQMVQADPSRTVEIIIPTESPSDALTDPVILKAGDVAPTTSLTLLDGATVRPGDLVGKTILIDFWATWCPPCVAELPQLIDVYKRFGARKDFAMLGVSLDVDRRALTDVVKARALKWHQVYGDTAQAAADKFGVSSIPAVFLIGSDGKIVARDLRGEDIARRLEEVLKATPGDVPNRAAEGR